LARGAVSTLEGIVSDESLLDRMQRSVGAQTLDGRDSPPIDLGGERQAGENALPVNVNCAGAALTLVAPLFCTIEVAVFTKRVEQRDSRFDFQHMLRAVDP
jgi:hypothetical protein